jgi:cytochrome b561
LRFGRAASFPESRQTPTGAGHSRAFFNDAHNTDLVLNLKNNTLRYGALSMLLHWTIALLIIALLGLGLYMTSLANGDPKWAWYGLHKSIGLLVLALAIARWLWLRSHDKPALPENLKPWERTAARATHGLLYLIMFLLPVTGYVDSCAGDYHLSFFDWFDIPKLIPKDQALEQWSVWLHASLAYALMGLLALHLGAVAKHQWLLKDKLLSRMLPEKH